MRRPVLVAGAVAALGLAAIPAVLLAQEAGERASADDIVHTYVRAGDVSASAVARRVCGPDVAPSYRDAVVALNQDNEVWHVGESLEIPGVCVVLPPPTTTPTTEPPPPTDPPTTTTTSSTLPATTTTVAPTTTAPPATTTTAVATTTSTLPPTTSSTSPPTSTTQPPAGGDFLATFDVAADFYDRFDGDVHFRANDYDRNAAFHGDHDMSCGAPTTARQVHVPANDAGQTIASEVFWYCAPGGSTTGHVMTGMGPAEYGYSVLSFKPKQTFTDVNRVCIDANGTDLGGDVWWEMSVIPKATFDANGGRLDYITALATDIDSTGVDFPAASFVYQINDNKIRTYQGMSETLFDWFRWSTTDRAARYTHCIVDNGNGTVTATREVGVSNQDAPGGVRTVTVPGSFPAGESVVLFQHSTYDPPKHGSGPTQTTLHWDNATVDVD